MNAVGLVHAAGCRCVSGIELCIAELILIWSCDDLHSFYRSKAILTDYNGEPRDGTLMHQSSFQQSWLRPTNHSQDAEFDNSQAAHNRFPC